MDLALLWLSQLMKTCPQVHLLVVFILMIKINIRNIEGCWEPDTIVTKEFNFICILFNVLKHLEQTTNSRHKLRGTFGWKLFFFRRWIHIRSPSLKTDSFLCLFACLLYFSICFKIWSQICSCNFLSCSLTSPLKTWKYFVKGNDVNFWSIRIKTTKTSKGLCPCKWSDYIWNLIERTSHCWMFFRTKLLKIFLILLFTISVWPFVCGWQKELNWSVVPIFLQIVH